MRIKASFVRGVLAMGALGCGFWGGAPRAEAQEPSPLERLERAAGVECLSTAASSNASCALAEAVKRCRNGDADACELAGKVNLSRAVHDVPRAAAAPFFLLRACTLAPDSCIGLVTTVMRSSGDEALARTLVETGCARSARVCRSAASLYAAGVSVPADRALAHRFAKRACARGDARACR